MKRKDLFSLQKAFDLTKDYSGLKFAYARVKNKKLVDAEIESIREAFKPSEEIQEYERLRIELLKEYGEMDSFGNFLFEEDGRSVKFASEEKKQEFVVKFNELRDKYKDCFDKETEKEIEYQKFIEEEVSLDFVKVNIDDLPKDITGEQLELLFPIINEG